MRIYHPYPDVAVVYYDDLHAKVDLYFTPDKVVINQPNHLGGRVERCLDEYTEFEGDLREWILSLRQSRC